MTKQPNTTGRATEAVAALARRHAAVGVSAYASKNARLTGVRRRAQAGADGWCILRTNGRRTLALAASLNRAGIEAWTPQEVRKRRLPRSRSFREYDEAIVPSFVFVRSSCLADVLRALAQPINEHPPFSVFQFAGRAPVIADGEMADLREREDHARGAYLAAQERARQAELRAIRKSIRPDVAVGSAVQLNGGAYAGLRGVVEKVNGGDAIVRISPTFAPKVASWLLIDADVETHLSPMSAAA